MLTTVHGKDLIKTKTDKSGKDIFKLQAVNDYNQNMGGVDISDAIMTHYATSRKSVKWYKKLFFGFLDSTILNANILYNESNQVKMPLLDFRLNLVEQIIEKYQVSVEAKESRSAETPLRLSGKHFPKLVESAAKKIRRRCFVCSRKKKRTETRFECKICKVGLCVVPCFEIYHSEEKI